MPTDRDHAFMELAILQARKAAELDEVPIGAVIVRGDEVIAQAHNRREIDHDPVAHAELLAIREASKKLGAWRLSGCELYVTLEPCVMCAGAIVLSRIDRLVYGATDPKAGAVESLYKITTDDRLNHRVEVVAGVEKEVCSKMLSSFFQQRRAAAKKL